MVVIHEAVAGCYWAKLVPVGFAARAMNLLAGCCYCYCCFFYWRRCKPLRPPMPPSNIHASRASRGPVVSLVELRLYSSRFLFVNKRCFLPGPPPPRYSFVG